MLCINKDMFVLIQFLLFWSHWQWASLKRGLLKSYKSQLCQDEIKIERNTNI